LEAPKGTDEMNQSLDRKLGRREKVCGLIVRTGQVAGVADDYRVAGCKN